MQVSSIADVRRLARIEKMERKDRAEGRLIDFIRMFWDIVEPGRRFVDGWHVEAICEHLEAVTYGEINRLLMNVPPGSTKSLTTNVFWPAWEWGPRGLASMQYVCASYNEDLTIRDNGRFQRLIESDRYKELWGDRWSPSRRDWGKEKLANDHTGFKVATSVGGVSTGARGDRFIVDDPHNVMKAESDAVRLTTNNWFRESVTLRMNDPIRSAIVVIMQRVHEEDVSGLILASEFGYEHLMLPMRYDPDRHCRTSIGFQDPRGLDDEGDLLHPDECRGALMDPVRFPEHVVARDEKIMGPYAAAAQLDQAPSPRGGGILNRDWWKSYPDDLPGQEPESFDDEDRPVRRLEYPAMDLIIVSADTAYTEKTENDWSACTVWGVWRDQSGLSKILLMEAWQERLHTRELAAKLVDTCRRRNADHLLIEYKANGQPAAQEVARLCRAGEWTVHPVNPRGDKVARAHGCVPLLFGGVVFRPHRKWAELVVDECAKFPKGKHDDLVDSTTQALLYLRRIGVAKLTEESEWDNEAAMMYESESGEPLYDV